MNSKELLIEEQNTINNCIYSYLPSMFFSIFISNYLFLNNYYEIFKSKFNLNKKDIGIIILSIFSGYPNNIRLLNESKNEYLLYSTNFINPVFFIMTFNNLYLKNNKLCLTILISHYLSNIIIFLIYKNKNKYFDYKKENISNSYTKSLILTIKTLSIIFSNLLFITLLITLLKLIIHNTLYKAILIGIIEFSNGIIYLSKLNIISFYKGLLILIIISFGSISIFLQSISLNSKIKSIKFLFNKILNTLIAILIYLILNVIIQAMH